MLKYLMLLTLVLGSCGDKPISIETARQELGLGETIYICESESGLFSWAGAVGRCNAVNDSCPSGFVRKEVDKKLEGESCKEVICGHPDSSGDSTCFETVLQE